MTLTEARKLTQALLLEQATNVAVVPLGDHVDFTVDAPTPLGSGVRIRYRLFARNVTDADVAEFKVTAEGEQVVPVLIALAGAPTDAQIQTLGKDEWTALVENSSLVVQDGQGQPSVDVVALRSLRDYRDVRLALVSGFLWLRPLSRNRVPAPLRWSQRPPHELFERCFFQTMTTGLRCTGESWGTRSRGLAMPDGVLRFPGVDSPILYDCKAAANGYTMSMDDVRGFADYLKSPLPGAWTPNDGETPGLLVVSSEIGTTRSRTFEQRRADVRSRAPGAGLYWVRAADISAFVLALERASVTPQHRDEIPWSEILAPGDVRSDSFTKALAHLRRHGYVFNA